MMQEVYSNNILGVIRVDNLSPMISQVMLASSLEQNKKSDGKAIGVSLGYSLFWPISEQREEMNPVPATEKILYIKEFL